MEKTKIKPWDIIKSLFGFLFSPVSNFIELLIQLGTIAFKGANIWLSPNRTPDKIGAALPFASTFSRVFAFTAFILCVLGFAGALVLPIPGVAPLYVTSIGILAKIGPFAIHKFGMAAVGAIAKAGIVMSAWTMAARAIGAAIGCLFDRVQHKKRELNVDKSHLPNPVWVGLIYGLFGSLVSGFGQVVNRVKEYFEAKKESQAVELTRYKNSETRVMKKMASPHAGTPKKKINDPTKNKIEQSRMQALSKYGSKLSSCITSGNSTNLHDDSDGESEGEGESQHPHRSP